ncbi:hypothetical protein [Maribacter sp. 1_2014MBL_MicDiv]|uniref:hypothetical protein n=1 Tax=Maribacter sp. 1_2014MBL_MicDiv TaxID=1644130 RepID=UPI0008F555F3|nr:hypothetical protein [Maribacter sp. 1_2014MBL_MicDiv]APA65377.1 hypothetical protein YQ22_14280 [Maribacter sp. 1_2014MBL_MicDiv]
MKLKHKVLVFNFLAFAILFIVFRVVLYMTLTISSIYLSVIAAILASFLAPKFAVAKIKGVEKIVMKWIFIKGFKVL